MAKCQPSTMNAFFQKGDEFFINRYQERTREECVYHSHEFVELCYVYSGNGFHIVGEQEYSVMKGDLFIINHDIPHVFYTKSQASLVTYNIMFKPGFFDSTLINFNDFGSITLSYLFRNICEEDYARENLRLSPEEQFAFEAIIESTHREYTLKQDGYMNIIRAYMIQLIIHIMRSIKTRLINGHSMDRSSSMIDSVINYLRQNYSHNFNLNELALKSFYSKNYLCTLFKESTGYTISQYVQNLRVKEACNLLEGTQRKITDIACAVGFSDYKAFNVSFKKLLGITPKEYRNKHQHPPIPESVL